MKQMKQTIFLVLCAMAIGDAAAFAGERIDISCVGAATENAGKALDFSLSPGSFMAQFSNVEALDGAQLQTEKPISYQVDGNAIHVDYDWYYTASYELSFSKPVASLGSGDSVTMKLSGDDYDNHRFDSESFNCKVR